MNSIPPQLIASTSYLCKAESSNAELIASKLLTGRVLSLSVSIQTGPPPRQDE
jgi:hypothetical protein